MTDMWTGTSLFISPEFIPKKYLGQDEIGILSTQRCKKKKEKKGGGQIPLLVLVFQFQIRL
jgi:hypothetical protein